MADSELAKELADQEAFLRSGKRPAASVQRVSRLPSQTGSAGAPAVKGAGTAGGHVAATAPPTPKRPSAAPPRHGSKDVIDGSSLPLLNPDSVLPSSKPPAPRRHDLGPPEAPQSAVVGEIRERTLNVGAPRAMNHARGFPQAMHRDRITAELRAQLRATSLGGPSADPMRRGGVGVGGGAAPSSGLDVEISRSGVDAENRSSLSTMSEQGIREARAKLLETLDPGLVQKLRRARGGGGGGGVGGGAGGGSGPVGAAVASPASANMPPGSVPAMAPLTQGPAAPGSSSTRVQFSQGPGQPGYSSRAGAAPAAPTLDELKLEWTLPADAPPLLPTGIGDSGGGAGSAAGGSGGFGGKGDHTGGSSSLGASQPGGSAEAALEAAMRAAGMHEERFDFGGRLVTGDREEHEGLHHHGDAPEAAGYTLAELVRLSRSTVPAQRASALRTLARVWQVQNTTRLARLVRRWTRDADVALLLRVALDDNHASARAAALDAAASLAVLLGAPTKRAIFAATRAAQTSYRGCEALPLQADAPAGDTGGGEEDTGGSRHPDAAACRADLLTGWVTMQLAERLRFLLEDAGTSDSQQAAQHLSPAAQEHALLLLCMAAHRSLSLASKVAKTPFLVGAIASLLLDPNTGGGSVGLCLALVQLMASSGREVAAALLGAGVLHALHAVYTRGLTQVCYIQPYSSILLSYAWMQSYVVYTFIFIYVHAYI